MHRECYPTSAYGASRGTKRQVRMVQAQLSMVAIGKLEKNFPILKQLMVSMNDAPPDIHGEDPRPYPSVTILTYRRPTYRSTQSTRDAYGSQCVEDYRIN